MIEAIGITLKHRYLMIRIKRRVLYKLMISISFNISMKIHSKFCIDTHKTKAKCKMVTYIPGSLIISSNQTNGNTIFCKFFITSTSFSGANSKLSCKRFDTKSGTPVFCREMYLFIMTSCQNNG